MLIHLLVLLQPFELVPVLFQHRCLHLNNGCEKPELELYFTWSFLSLAREPQLIMLSRVMSAISSRLLAAMSRLTVPFKRRDRSSKREWRERVATCGLLHRLPPSSTSSSNFTHLKKENHHQDLLEQIYNLAVSFHSMLPSSPT